MSAELAHLKTAIAALEAQRDVLGEAGLAAALAPLLARVAALEEPERPADAGERKQITVMFADLSGFTKLSENADAEDVRNLVNACFDCVGDVVTHFGGYIDKFIGDELMVLFGAPRAMEDHASRALHAALEMRDALAAFRLEHAPLRAHELSMHFGVNSGEVIAGEIGSESRRAYTVMGDAVNVAARLVARARARSWWGRTPAGWSVPASISKVWGRWRSTGASSRWRCSGWSPHRSTRGWRAAPWRRRRCSGAPPSCGRCVTCSAMWWRAAGRDP